MLIVLKKIEDALNNDKNIKQAIVYFSTSKVIIETDLQSPFSYINKIVKEKEPEVILSETEIKENTKEVIQELKKMV